MIQLAGELGVPLATCVAGTSLRGDDLVDPAREIAGEQELAVLRNILGALGPEVPFGLQAGLRYRATMMGAWGFAIITSTSFREAIDVGMRYFDLTYSFNRLGFELEGRQGRLLYDGSDNPDDLRATLIERDMAALIAMERDILGRIIPAELLHLSTPRPAYAAAFEPLFGITPVWGQDADCIGFDASILDDAGPFADRLGLRVSEELCRAMLDQRRARSGLAGRVRARILRTSGQIADMKAVAMDLGMSTRTLRNQLKRETTSYRELVEEIRQTLSEQLLATKELTVDQIAERVGYADSSSFIAAFKRWKGVAPGEYRSGRG
jgi:AraC-like DNA-binding protein